MQETISTKHQSLFSEIKKIDLSYVEFVQIVVKVMVSEYLEKIRYVSSQGSVWYISVWMHVHVS